MMNSKKTDATEQNNPTKNDMAVTVQSFLRVGIDTIKEDGECR